MISLWLLAFSYWVWAITFNQRLIPVSVRIRIRLHSLRKMRLWSQIGKGPSLLAPLSSITCDFEVAFSSRGICFLSFSAGTVFSMMFAACLKAMLPIRTVFLKSDRSVLRAEQHVAQEG